MTISTARVVIVLALFAVLVATPVVAAQITYGVYVSDVSLQMANTTYACTTTSDPNCAFISITAVGNTADVQPFSVTGASGFINLLPGASPTVNIFLNGGQSFTETLLPGQISVAVDQTNGGAGFGSAFGPTYPMATYGGGADYAHYNLQTNFYVQGFGGFCPDPTACDTGGPLHTVSGDDITISYPFRPDFSIFSSQVAVPEPATGSLLLAAAGVGLRALRRRRT
jgi:hypothetical protein